MPRDVPGAGDPGLAAGGSGDGRARRGPAWRSLDRLASAESTEKIDELLGREFPHDAVGSPGSTTRREFLTLMGASLALAGTVGCRPPREEIVPYVETPEEITAGEPLYFATAMTLGGIATGLLVEQRMGRPVKVEGNPDHPASLGATDAFAQAAVLSLYDPDRSTTAIHQGKKTSWPRAAEALGEVVEDLRSRGGAGLRVLTETVTSPTLTWQLEQLLEELPDARWHQYEPVTRHAPREGARQAFGREVDPVYNLERADVILALDADFLDCGAGHLRWAREFADQRRVWRQEPKSARMNRLYAVGPTPSPTSSIADHHYPLRAADVLPFARAVAERLGVSSAEPAPERGTPTSPIADLLSEDRLTALVEDLRSHRGRSLVVAGDFQPPSVHALAHALNAALENVGETVSYIPPVHSRPVDEMQSLRELTEAMQRGEVEALVVLGGNPAFNAPADVEFVRHLKSVPFRMHVGLYHDETAAQCSWHVPEAHFLERWDDARAYNGAVSLVQPLIAPLYDGVSPIEVVSALRGQSGRSAYDLLREFHRAEGQGGERDFESAWKNALHDGVIEGTAFAPVEVEPREQRRDEQPASESRSDAAAAGDAALEIVFRPDPTVYDGRFANNAWLQELPKPLLKTTWDNVAAFGPETARRLGITMEIGDHGGDVLTDVVELRYRGRSVEAPAWILPGHAEGSVTVYMGYGRTRAGQVGNGHGFDAYRVRTSDRPWFDAGLEVRKSGRRDSLAATQLHHALHGRDIVRAGTLQQYRQHPEEIAKPHHEKGGQEHRPGRSALPILDQPPSDSEEVSAPPSPYPEHDYPRHKWGMVVDQTVCIGCNACVIACQSENNVPVVGKDEVRRGREMHWLRVDTYYHGEDLSRPEVTYSQPVPCMHCEKAPCEVVCPVNATVHSDEGLNDMNYARCVGTRYCSNNCPYKVRRFNHFQYADWETESLKALRNPDVTVRSRGVMEKCTYCVQRINAARIHAEKDDRPLQRNREGEWVKPIYENELLTACQAACPTSAIVFGDLNDTDSQVSRMRDGQPLEYGMLAEELGTQPRTRYLAALRNPNRPETGR